MQQEQLRGEFLNSTQIESLPKEELIKNYQLVVDELTRAIREIYRLKNQSLSEEQLRLVMQEQQIGRASCRERV